jgi:very-short-patch-repair endonuclease
MRLKVELARRGGLLNVLRHEKLLDEAIRLGFVRLQASVVGVEMAPGTLANAFLWCDRVLSSRARPPEAAVAAPEPRPTCDFVSPIEQRFAAALFAVLAVAPRAIAIQPQASVGAYRADLLLANGRQRVAVECDGHDFHERTKQQAEHDKKRDRFFAAEGITVLRFTGTEIHRNARACAIEALSVLGRGSP